MVAHLTDILHCAYETRRQWQVGVEQQVACGLAVEVYSNADALLKEAEVEAEVPLLCGLPLKVLVGH